MAVVPLLVNMAMGFVPATGIDMSGLKPAVEAVVGLVFYLAVIVVLNLIILVPIYFLGYRY
jgi:hypothetical protein